MVTNTGNSFWNEKWVRIDFGDDDAPRYEVSNYGRLKSFQTNRKEGKIIKGSVIQGYSSLNIRISRGKSANRYVHKLVAEHFLEQKSPRHRFVIHLDYEKQNNYHKNLKWATKDEVAEHNKDNPAMLNRVTPRYTKNYKLTETKVRMIRKLLKKRQQPPENDCQAVWHHPHPTQPHPHGGKLEGCGMMFDVRRSFITYYSRGCCAITEVVPLTP